MAKANQVHGNLTEQFQFSGLCLQCFHLLSWSTLNEVFTSLKRSVARLVCLTCGCCVCSAASAPRGVVVCDPFGSAGHHTNVNGHLPLGAEGRGAV